MSGASASGPLTAGHLRGYHGLMKHLPEQHQSIAPTPSVWIGLGAIALVMAVVWVVVSLAAN